MGQGWKVWSCPNVCLKFFKGLTGGTFELSAFQLVDAGDHAILKVVGDWTVSTVGEIDSEIRKLKLPDKPVVLNVTELGRMDTAGAWIIERTLSFPSEQSADGFRIEGRHDEAEALLNLVYERREDGPPHEPHRFTLIDFLARIGRVFVNFLEESADTLSFIGRVVASTLKLLTQPHKIRWTSVVSVMEEAGLDALPIVCFLSFFVGVVIAFIGATMLQQTLGSTVFTVELVGWAMMREFGVVLTGILLAGRTNSSFTAQIGSMKMRQEVDAMRTLGLDPIETLVTPRVLAMLIMTPFLTFGATLSGLLGGLIISWLALDISPILYVARLQDLVTVQNFWVGMSKSPFIALIVAIVACRQGLLVEGNVQSLGRATTASVVHAIFLIIVVDAVFAMIYMELGI
ncbi:MAG: ABC transporter permease [Ponticaulis sp.]|nr:ABC transporter permease [Ponticaulis sp.]